MSSGVAHWPLVPRLVNPGGFLQKSPRGCCSCDVHCRASSTAAMTNWPRVRAGGRRLHRGNGRLLHRNWHRQRRTPQQQLACSLSCSTRGRLSGGTCRHEGFMALRAHAAGNQRPLHNKLLTCMLLPNTQPPAWAVSCTIGTGCYPPQGRSSW